MADIRAVAARVNEARAACSLPPLQELPNGERSNPCFCPLGRALRKDMGEFFFLAVGSKHIRLASTNGATKEIAQRIQQAWGVESEPVPAGEQFATVPLPVELRQFVNEFDAGKLPKFEGRIEQAEKARFDGLARRLWNITLSGLRRMRPLPRSRRT